MISQGTDGVSRGEMLEGVMKGDAMLDFIPLGKGACERSNALLPWIQSWLGEDSELLYTSGVVW